MLIPRKPLEAYRLDSAVPALDPAASAWLTGCLAYATVLDHVIRCAELGPQAAASSPDHGASLPQDLGVAWTRLRAVAEAHELLEVQPPPQPADPMEAICSLTRDIGQAGERLGALQSAYSLLTMLDRLPLQAAPLERGRVLALRGRIARKADDLDVAEELYRRVGVIARQTKSPELRARSLIGRGVVAQSRGNYPVAKRSYASAARAAERAADASLCRVANHGLMVVAAQYGELGLALEAGWRAFRGALGKPHLEAEMLLNLGQFAFDAGDAKAALHAFAAALTRQPPMWCRLPALGGLARAAAAMKNKGVLLNCVERLEANEAGATAFAYPRASAWWDVARALEVAGAHTDGVECARRANMIATAHGFHELALASEAFIAQTSPAAPVTAPVSHATASISRSARTVLEELSTLERPERALQRA